ncbi:MAG TPA: aminotransferase class V-fold PLP-dependent enzyme [Negativicutes bacterium]|nr:aminotransferase class V-fold PLP-dependent enzyme [Negativicutes bacterium]
MSILPVYLDNAATSWPKHPSVIAAMQDYLENCGGSPGRAGHGKAIASTRMVYNTRDLIATLFNAPLTDRVIFTKNATEAINMVLFGFLNPGDHVVVSSMEHNAVMRPLRELEIRGIDLSIVQCDFCGRLDPAKVKSAFTPRTRLVLLTHASNVTGTLLPIAEVAAIAREAEIPFAVDAAQTAGVCPLDIQAIGIDFLAFTGHKSLGGPQGTGGLVIGPNVDLRPLVFGGTGSASESDIQPSFLPDKLESGTLNAVGIAGLGAAISALNNFGIENVLRHERQLMKFFRDGLREIPQITVYGSENPHEGLGVLSLNIADHSCEEVGLRLERDFDILTRTGLQCAPAAHHTLGTFERGTVRFSVSGFTSEEDILATLAALAKIVRS